MSLTVDTGQLSLAQRLSVSCLPLVVLETFSDRDARTVSNTYYWTRGGPLVYQWDGATDSIFSPVLREISPIVRGFKHLPDQGEFSTREVVRLAIDATPRAGNYLWQELLSDKIIGARVTVGSLLVDLSGADDDPRHFDLTALGDVHTVRWRGEITDVPTLLDSANVFELTAESEEMRLEATRIMSGVDTAHPEDVGKPYPVPLGTQLVRALFYDVGLVGTLADDLLSTDSTVNVAIDGDRWGDPFAETYDFTGTGSKEQTYAGEIMFPNARERFLSAIETSDLLAVGSISSRGTNDYFEGESVAISPYMIRFAVSGGPVSGVGSRCFVTSPNQAKTDVFTLSLPPDLHIENIENGDAGGHVAVVTVDPNTFFYGAYDPTLSEVLIEVDGPYSVSDTTTTFQAIGSDAANWTALGGGFGVSTPDFDTNWQQFWSENSGSSISNKDILSTGSGDGLIVDVAGDQVQIINADRCVTTIWRRSYGTPKTGPVELTFTITLSAAALAQTRRIILTTNKQSGGFIFDDMRRYEGSELVEGANVLKLQAFATSIDSIEIIVVWTDSTTLRGFSITEDIDAATITVEAPAGSHPIDVVELVVDNFLPTDAVGYDATSFATAKTNTPSLAVLPDLSRYITLGEFLAAVGFNSRINFVLSEGTTGTEIKAYAAETDYDFPAVVRAIGAEFTGLKLALRPLAEIANRFTAVYDLEAGADGSLFASYGTTLVANELTNDISAKVSTADITASQTDFGMREAIEIPFQMLTDATTAIDVLGYYATEALRGQVERYTILVPWWLGYDLEPGDIVSIQPAWETTAQKCRVTQVVFNFSENGVGLNLEAVT